MPVPVEWLGNFQVNTGTAATGTQADPRIIGLDNGNILIAWEESASGAIGTTPGSDIIGKIFDAEGNVVRDSYRLNVAASVDDERDFDIAATSDGGFVMVYIDDDISDAERTSVIWERFDAGGDAIDSVTVADESIAANDLHAPAVSVDLLTNISMVTFVEEVGANHDARGNTVSAAGVLGTEFDAGGAAGTVYEDTVNAMLANGNLVVVSEVTGGPAQQLRFKIVNASGGVVVVDTQVANTGGALGGANPQVASLKGGGFVVVWESEVSGDTFVKYAVYDSSGANLDVGVATLGSGLRNEGRVVALADGDFVVFWDNDTTDQMEGKRFNPDGSDDGGVFVVDAAPGTDPDIGLTADGRLLFAWRANDGAGEIVSEIWDPRGSTINATDYNDFERNFLAGSLVTGGTAATTINGNGGLGLTILGQAGADTITGGLNSQTLRGGGGNDSIFGDDATPTSTVGDSIDGGGGADTILGARGGDTILGGIGNDVIDGHEGADQIDGGSNFDILTGGLGDDTITASALIVSNVADSIDGGEGADSLTGANAGDTIVGGNGDDTIAGGVGGDSLDGGANIDTLTYAASDAAVNVLLNGTGNGGGHASGDLLAGFDVLIGSDFNDTLDANSDGGTTLDGGDGDDRIDGGLNSQHLIGGAGDDTIFAAPLFNSAVGDRLDGGTGDDSLVGAAGGDTIRGEEQSDLIDGREGNDSLDGGLGSDTIEGGLGNDTITAAIEGSAASDRLSGGEGDDSLTGSLGNDVLEGGGGADALDGGDGGDFADYSGAALKVTADLQVSTRNRNDAAGDSYASVEHLRGSAQSDKLRGDTSANILDGGEGRDSLEGRKGGDTLIGGGGQDTLDGGQGADQFRLTTLGAGGLDRLADFTPGQDVIALDGSVFGLAPGALSASNFVVAQQAQDADDFFVYRADTGKLFFDADGNGAGALVPIATLLNLATLSAGDFVVI